MRSSVLFFNSVFGLSETEGVNFRAEDFAARRSCAGLGCVRAGFSTGLRGEGDLRRTGGGSEDSRISPTDDLAGERPAGINGVAFAL